MGAGTGDAFRLAVGQGMRLVALGGVVGLVGALVCTRFLRSLLYGVQPTDPPTFGAVAILLAVVALLATAIPARRASRVDPAVALRAD